MTLQPKFLSFIKYFLSLPPVCTLSCFSNCITITKIGNRQSYISSRKIAKTKQRNKRRYWNQLALRCVVWHLELSAPSGGIARNDDPSFFPVNENLCFWPSNLQNFLIFLSYIPGRTVDGLQNYWRVKNNPEKNLCWKFPGCPRIDYRCIRCQ